MKKTEVIDWLVGAVRGMKRNGMTREQAQGLMDQAAVNIGRMKDPADEFEWEVQRQSLMDLVLDMVYGPTGVSAFPPAGLLDPEEARVQVVEAMKQARDRGAPREYGKLLMVIVLEGPPGYRNAGDEAEFREYIAGEIDKVLNDVWGPEPGQGGGRRAHVKGQ